MLERLVPLAGEGLPEPCLPLGAHPSTQSILLPSIAPQEPSIKDGESGQDFVPFARSQSCKWAGGQIGPERPRKDRILEERSAYSVPGKNQ